MSAVTHDLGVTYKLSWDECGRYHRIFKCLPHTPVTTLACNVSASSGQCQHNASHHLAPVSLFSPCVLLGYVGLEMNVLPVALPLHQGFARKSPLSHGEKAPL